MSLHEKSKLVHFLTSPTSGVELGSRMKCACTFATNFVVSNWISCIQNVLVDIGKWPWSLSWGWRSSRRRVKINKTNMFSRCCVVGFEIGISFQCVINRTISLRELSAYVTCGKQNLMLLVDKYSFLSIPVFFVNSITFRSPGTVQYNYIFVRCVSPSCFGCASKTDRNVSTHSWFDCFKCNQISPVISDGLDFRSDILDPHTVSVKITSNPWLDTKSRFHSHYWNHHNKPPIAFCFTMTKSSGAAAMSTFIHTVIFNNQTNSCNCDDMILNIPEIVQDQAKSPSQSLRKQMSEREIIQKENFVEDSKGTSPFISSMKSRTKGTSFYCAKKTLRIRGFKMDLSRDERWQNSNKNEHASCHMPPPKPLRSSPTMITITDSPVRI